MTNEPTRCPTCGADVEDIFDHVDGCPEEQDNPPTPPPGSQEALDLGCLCPVLDNGYGRGFGGIAGLSVVNSACPVHWHDGEVCMPCEVVPKTSTDEVIEKGTDE
jgi:hypothetical protein